MRDFGQEQGRSKVLAENQEMANESSHFLSQDLVHQNLPMHKKNIETVKKKLKGSIETW
jgi:hypothetical protein